VEADGEEAKAPRSEERRGGLGLKL